MKILLIPDRSIRADRFGFSLLEVLATIAIIAVLAALLVPTYGRMKDQSMMARCVSNLRTIAGASLAYANENNGLLPASYTPNDPRYGSDSWWPWRIAIAGLLPVPDGSNAAKVWNCPKAEKLALRSGCPPPINWTYLRVKNFYPNWETTGTAAETRIAQVQNPSRQILLIDGQLDSESHAGSRNSACTSWAWISPPGHDPGSGAIGFLHDRCANAAFFDGHVEALAEDRITQDMCDDPDP